MKVDWAFPRQILLSLGVIAIFGSYPLFTYGSHDIIVAAVAGAVLATVNVLAGYVAIEYSFDKSVTTFFKYVLGGMGVRLLLMTLVLVLLIRILQFHAGALVVSLGIFYVVYLVLEILHIQKKVGIRQQR